ncbi:hypothetical protein [Algoriphagus boritolerans]|uniref:Uncharacterized protein n=1 Tax=Algoriphagus boritolerans DSM 17298 = JCM 18970 TaxID=1120964 RepID=A0A1H5TM21_9BACT|nr:hypothetical protein [Algoriphagus boritolerans]SEF63830.1 hypothetical protein SAMN03080598_00834 [Algoriphagus boritolerans DSM 17298 = JCM 18970]
MAKANPKLIKAIEDTASKLLNGANYQWGHMGACNCGNLAQELTHLTKGEIHQYAMQKQGDWNEQVLEYCPSSGYPIDLMISKMLEFGLTLEDLANLEKLSDHSILSRIPKERRDQINKNSREDVVLYMETWAKILRENWILDNETPIELELKKKLELPVLV